MDMMGMLADRRAVQRRNALRALGIGMTALAAGTAVTEGKRKGQGRGKGKQQTRNRCPGQVVTCEEAFTEFCQEWVLQEDCLRSVRECCAPLETCDAGAAMDCVVFRFLTA